MGYRYLMYWVFRYWWCSMMSRYGFLYLVTVRDHRVNIKFLLLIAELLDIDTINESEEGAESLIQVPLFVFWKFKGTMFFSSMKHFRLVDTSDEYRTSVSDFDSIVYVDPVRQMWVWHQKRKRLIKNMVSRAGAHHWELNGRLLCCLDTVFSPCFASSLW
jgi:hypothetical protein